jgi:hypothetical protein
VETVEITADHNFGEAQLGHPKRSDVNVEEIKRLRAGGLSWRKIAALVHVPVTTCIEHCAENLEEMALYG